MSRLEEIRAAIVRNPITLTSTVAEHDRAWLLARVDDLAGIVIAARRERHEEHVDSFYLRYHTSIDAALERLGEK